MNDTDERFMHGDNRQQSNTGTGGTQGSDKAQQNKEQAQQKARETADQARDEALRRADSQKGFVADYVSNFSEAVRSMAMQFKDQDQVSLADYTYRLADKTDTFADRLRDENSESLLKQAQDFSRREPALFIGGMVAGGFLLSRFLKSSNR
ncbi:hypothetical protein [Kushneria indalinina]|uniref:ElaB/YqjD/DUF883 family membrane-anchored ribosome-binding protein n=1 Tax=Kushneria indalinina DSM 14324 TaxID=1122140 RepID=A0A3D9DVN5_9GAMM|nr:hypothetical protein [Kushneria indalinina]REC94725.1 hypothetical protein C8D72_1551 [Kushneria indalinina DSM 14324]